MHKAWCKWCFYLCE